MTATQSPGVTPASPEPAHNGPAGDGETSKVKRVLKRILTSLTVLFACIGAVSASGYTIKDDLVPYVLDLTEKDATYAITSPAPRSKPVIVKRCTEFSVRAAGGIPAGYELWLGTNLRGRKAIVEPMDDSGNGNYRASITIGRQQDHDQSRELDVLLLTPEAADWLEVVADGRSLYDVASNKWLPGVRVVARMDVRRSSTANELNCSGKA